MSSMRRRDGLGGERALVWLCGGALALVLLGVSSLFVLLLTGASQRFLVADVELFRTEAGSFFGVVRDETSFGLDGERALLVDRGELGGGFVWIPASEVRAREKAPDVVLVESLYAGHVYGRVRGIRTERGELDVEGGGAQALIASWIERKRVERSSLRAFERGAWRVLNRELDELRVQDRELAARDDLTPERRGLLRAQLRRFKAARERERSRLSEVYAARRAALEADHLLLEAAEGELLELRLSGVERASFVNRLSRLERVQLVGARLASFFSDGPAAGGARGGIFPAIFGTALMVILMSVAVTPLGVLAAVYLREYARQGPLTRALRFMISNLAGTPSIVFGVFGLGFFVYTVGASIDELCFAKTLPAPTFGTGGLLWASLTLALLTLPVVIVATDEGLRSVPRGVREGALALGATRFESIMRVVLPAAAPGVLTGVILAVARAAGEVAPLMIVGLANAAPSLPIDGNAPFVHLERRFMHLGMQIFEGGFQSAGGAAGLGAVFASAALLVLVVAAMNVTAMLLRHYLRRRYAESGM